MTWVNGIQYLVPGTWDLTPTINLKWNDQY